MAVKQLVLLRTCTFIRMFVSFCGRLPAVPGKDSTLSGDAYKGKVYPADLADTARASGYYLETSPDLPQELLRAMGHQVLASHVSLIMCSVKIFPIQLLTKYSYSVVVYLVGGLG